MLEVAFSKRKVIRFHTNSTSRCGLVKKKIELEGCEEIRLITSRELNKVVYHSFVSWKRKLLDDFTAPP
jgi:hypothetical protein